MMTENILVGSNEQSPWSPNPVANKFLANVPLCTWRTVWQEDMGDVA